VNRQLTLGSRGSALALWQARYVAGLLKENSIETRIEIIKTSGDRLSTASLRQSGGKGLFTKEIEQALLDHSIDVAVHSLKDLPTEITPGLTIAAIPEREDPRDALVGSTLASLKTAARVGTSSGRRAAQLRHLRADLRIELIRGNVDTRLRKLKQGQFDAVMLAAAGLRRLGFENEIAEVLSPDQMCPAPGQGALAVQTRAADVAEEICRALDHEDSRTAVEAERAVLAGVGGGCQLPVGAFARKIDHTWRLTAIVAAIDGSRVLRENSALEPLTVVQRLLERGARELLVQSTV
jgi:hydroxymethylbilane synthase